MLQFSWDFISGELFFIERLAEVVKSFGLSLQCHHGRCLWTRMNFLRHMLKMTISRGQFIASVNGGGRRKVKKQFGPVCKQELNSVTFLVLIGRWGLPHMPLV